MLIGGNLYPTILRSGIEQNVWGSLLAQETIFGWILTGPIPNNTQQTSTISSFYTELSLDCKLQNSGKSKKSQEGRCSRNPTNIVKNCMQGQHIKASVVDTWWIFLLRRNWDTLPLVNFGETNAHSCVVLSSRCSMTKSSWSISS